MRYFSDITNMKYDTVEELLTAEDEAQKATKNEVKTEPKCKPIDNDRKLAAQKIEELVTKALNAQDTAKARKEELKNKLGEIDAKYRELYKKLVNQKTEDERDVISQIKACDKEVDATYEAVQKELVEFCKKYGPYHYSVDTKNFSILPILRGFGEERLYGLFGDFLADLF